MAKWFISFAQRKPYFCLNLLMHNTIPIFLRSFVSYEEYECFRVLNCKLKVTSYSRPQSHLLVAKFRLKSSLLYTPLQWQCNTGDNCRLCWFNCTAAMWYGIDFISVSIFSFSSITIAYFSSSSQFTAEILEDSVCCKRNMNLAYSTVSSSKFDKAFFISTIALATCYSVVLKQVIINS
jgi:hypothetical protein